MNTPRVHKERPFLHASSGFPKPQLSDAQILESLYDYLLKIPTLANSVDYRCGKSDRHNGHYALEESTWKTS